MTEKIDKLFTESPDDWIKSLPQYQQDRVNDLISKGLSLEDAASKWLSATPEHTAPFGTEASRKVFVDKIWDEIEKFLCGDARYEAERSKLLSESNIVHTYFVSVISIAIAPVLGSSAIFLAPVIALLLASLGKITLSAWCKARAANRSQHATDNA